MFGSSTTLTSLNLNGGTLEVRSDTPAGFGTKTLNLGVNGTAGTLFVDRAVGGSGLNQTVTIGTLHANAGTAQNTTWAISGRDGYNLTFNAFATGLTSSGRIT